MRREQTDNSKTENVVSNEGSEITVEKTTNSIRLTQGFYITTYGNRVTIRHTIYHINANMS